MKKLVLVAIMLLVPFTSFALDAMTDADLDELVAQAGVTIAISSLQITTNAADSAWGDEQSTAGNYAWLAQDAEDTVQTITINGVVKIDVMDSTDIVATLGTLANDTEIAAAITAGTATGVVFDVDIAIVNTGGTTQTLELNSTTGLDAEEIMGGGSANSSTLGTQYSASANQQIDGTIIIMAH